MISILPFPRELEQVRRNKTQIFSPMCIIRVTSTSTTYYLKRYTPQTQRIGHPYTPFKCLSVLSIIFINFIECENNVEKSFT